MKALTPALPVLFSLLIAGCTSSYTAKDLQKNEGDISKPEHTTEPKKVTQTEQTAVIKTKQPVQQVKKNPGDRKGHDMSEVVPHDQIPPAPILNIEQALAAFKVHDDFELQVVAQDPLLFDPIIVQYDAAGRVWAVEMTTFMQDVEATGQNLKESQIVVLTDTDQDGEMDHRQVVVEKILLPRAFAFVPGGFIWADNEQLYFTETHENQGQIRALKTEVVDPTYAKGGNLEHKTNGLLFSLDNWYYNAKSSNRYRPYPLSASLPANAKEIYRNHLWKMVRSTTEFRGQFGLTQDDYGRHYFNVNSTPLLTTSFIPNVANRNPKHKFAKKRLTQRVGTNDVYPARVTPGINRGYQTKMYTKDFKLKSHTSACGPLIYRGNQFAEQYYGIGLANEPAGNLIKATKITDKQGVVTGKNLFDKQEIIASTDERFRPVNAVNSPDGTITLVDFYHGIIQDRTFLTSYLVNQIKQRDLERSKHIGRLYRLKYKHKPLPKVDYLDKLSANELVPYLAHANGWHRDMAQQLLVMKQDLSAVNALKKMATSHANHLAQIKALWVLEGLGSIDFATLQAAGKTANDKVKVSVYRLAEFVKTTPVLQTWLNTQAKQASNETYAALSLAAGTHQAWPAITQLINTFTIDDFIIASLGHQESPYLAAESHNINLEARKQLMVLSELKIEAKQVKKHSAAVAAQIAQGKELFNGKAGCFGCHGADGEGNQFVPPLNKSEWVTGSQTRLTAILLHGLAGPITVNGKLYETPMTMPGLATNAGFKDADLAAIATYIRNEWDNNATPVSTATVTEVREQTKLQTTTYTAQSANEIK
ncbi:PVC-type heme-binding CxxCH protein [Algibacillus agarilyticus]|uniref:PVC-type heme-binding CxxCH protein n=1 Tax=Algibacillus agarilyticus TaxID=2234133 RepID=UPI000DD0769C|nr:PVC-type heme-binding CxxCH protein [Algibacillus agarilyticus]